MDVVVPCPLRYASWRQVLKGYFLDAIFDCPYEMHHLVENEDIFELIRRLSENHKEVLYCHSVRMYDVSRIAVIRGQTECKYPQTASSVAVQSAKKTAGKADHTGEKRDAHDHHGG